MFDRWKLKDFSPGEGESLRVYDESFSIHDWFNVSVPGGVHQALKEAGRIPDPFYNRNENECSWIEDREWWYRVQFDLEDQPLRSDERMRLVFHGLDTYTKIWLNGTLLGAHGNMFREAVFDISHGIRLGKNNTLALCFDPPLDHVKDKAPLYWLPGALEETKRNLMRKAQFGFGWDWAPHLPSIGIWRPVELRREHRAVIEGMHFATLEIDPSRNEALVSISVEIERFADVQPVEVALSLMPSDDANPIITKKMTLTGSGNKLVSEYTFSIEDPRLWWTHDLGNPSLYTLQVGIIQDGIVLDEKRKKVGVRTINLDQSPDPDEPGTRFFRFVLNGVPIFARGANWIPASSFVGGLTTDRYEDLIDAAKDANMNMLRVWGGGIYEHDSFYNICDRLGILVWQDFMFSCAPYPEGDPDFVEEVRLEARYQVRRLRSHPCMALWCGNNENQWLHQHRALEQEKTLPVPGTLYYEQILPEAVQELDGFTPYWPGSPNGGSHPNSMQEGDVHDWHVWHGLPVGEVDQAHLLKLFTSGPEPEDVSFSHYETNMGRFISEFGMHASPVYETLRRCIPLDQLYHHSPAMDHHNKDNPKNKGDNLMLTVTGLPKDLEEYIDFSMIAQAEGLKFGIEHFRRRKPHCSGTLLWQFNDCWPGLSWSILDYYGFGKAGYFYVRRAYAPILASFRAIGEGTVELWVTNDTLKEVEDTITIRLAHFSNGLIWEEQHSVNVPANSSNVIWRGGPDKITNEPDHFIAVRSQNESFPANRHFFAPVKDLLRSLAEPGINIDSHGNHVLSIQINASTYLFYVHITVPVEGIHFSDNYFDLAPGESRTILATNPNEPITQDMVIVKWR